MEERDIVIDIESFADTICDNRLPTNNGDELSKGENPFILSSNNVKNVPDLNKNTKKEKRMSMSAKKPPKPPRPPRGLSLDEADQKLIKEISELAMIKRARIERMKAFKKMKAAKASSASTSSTSNFIAMLFTVFFCVVILFQGCPSGILPMNSSASGIFPGSPQSNGATEGKLVFVDDQQSVSMEVVPGGSDSKGDERKGIR
ncbi:hypothetical protein ACP275_14G002900 [Erythranthe tilingii]